MVRQLSLFFSILAVPATAQNFPTAAEFENHVIKDELYGEVQWHLDSVNADEPGPLIVWLPGSGAMPYFQTFADGSVGFTFPIELLAFREDAHFLLIDKPGISFSGKVEFDEIRQRPIEVRNPVFQAGLTKENLVARAALAIEAARIELGSRATQIVIIGGSEGGQYTFELTKRTQADRAVAWGGIALPQYYDLVIDARLKAERGEITRTEAQRLVEQIYAYIRNIEQSPYDTSEMPLDAPELLVGETSRRWASFGPYSAVDDMLALDVPLLLIQGGADNNSPILNSDYAMITFLSRGRTNLEYWVYPDLDHYFRDVQADPTSDPASKEKEVWGRVWRWISGMS
jgi:pimeloyl-ACP methyl ester carboxylesterase